MQQPNHLMNWISELAEKAWEFMLKLLMMLLLWLSPIKDYIYLVLALFAINFVTGLLASHKEKIKFSAVKAWRMVYKFIMFTLAIISAYILEHIQGDGTNLAKIVSLYIGGVETYSILENIGRCTSSSILSDLWVVLKKKIDDYIGTLHLGGKKRRPFEPHEFQNEEE